MAECKYCKALIRWSEKPEGGWKAFNLDWSAHFCQRGKTQTPRQARMAEPVFDDPDPQSELAQAVLEMARATREMAQAVRELQVMIAVRESSPASP